MCQPPSTRSARVTSAPASDPAPGSVSAKPPMRSPRASGGTNRARCSSVPNASSGSVHGGGVDGDGDADTGVGARKLLEHERVRDEVGAGAAELSGTQTPSSPSSASCAKSSRGKRCVAVPLGGVRIDLGARELAGERLDLALLRPQLELHARECRAEACRYLRSGFELVADAEARLDERVLRRVAIDLLPQPADEDVDRAVAVGLTAAPDLLQQLVARDDAATVERERVEEPELGRREPDALAVDERLHLARVDAELLDLDRVAAALLAGRTPRRAAAPTRATSSRIENGFTR